MTIPQTPEIVNTVDGGAIYNSGTLTINGGEISNNSTAKSGGAISANNGTITVNGGEIKNNTANSNGGAIYLGTDSDTATLNLRGGSITGNTASIQGGGILNNGVLNVSGNPVVKNNTAPAYSKGYNIYLRGGKKVNVTGELKSGAEIGVTAPGGDTGVVTSGLSGNGTADSFFADNPDQYVSVNVSGEGTIESWSACTKLSVVSADGEYYISPSSKYYKKNSSSYTEITDTDEISLLSKIEASVTVNDTDDIIAQANPEIASDYIGARFLGVQKKSLANEQTKDRSLRFITEMSSDILLTLNSDESSDYGFVFAALNKNSESDYDKLTVTHSAAHKYSCKGTTNTLSNNFGNDKYTDGEDGYTSYKYITASLYNIPENAKLVARFYITYKGTTYYVNYANGNDVTGTAFDADTVLNG